MAEITIPAEPRTEFGKGAARRIRRADQVPAVLYGHGTDPVHVTLPGHALMLALKNSNALLSIEVGSESHLAIPKQVQRDPLKGFIEHADLLIVKRGEKVVVDVAIQLEGDAQPETLVVLENATVSLEVEATHIPEWIEVSVEGAEAGTLVYASDLVLPKGSELLTDPETLIVNVAQQQSEEALEADLESTEDELGIEKDESDDAAEGDADE